MARSQRSVFIVRHGESASNAGGVTVQHGLIPLTDHGREQANAVVSRLPTEPARILASPFSRAVDTAAPYAARVARTVELEPLLEEFNMIDPVLIAGMDQTQRRPIANAYWQEADPDKRLGEQAETFHHFAGRVSAFLAKKLPGLPDQTVCFGHGIWIGMAAWQLLGFSTEGSNAMCAFRRFQTGLPLPNTVIYRLVEMAPDTWSFQAVAGA